MQKNVFWFQPSEFSKHTTYVESKNKSTRETTDFLRFFYNKMYSIFFICVESVRYQSQPSHLHSGPFCLLPTTWAHNLQTFKRMNFEYFMHRCATIVIYFHTCECVCVCSADGWIQYWVRQMSLQRRRLAL